MHCSRHYAGDPCQVYCAGAGLMTTSSRSHDDIPDDADGAEPAVRLNAGLVAVLPPYDRRSRSLSSGAGMIFELSVGRRPFDILSSIGA